jgi:hypothetical protein
MIGSMSEDPKRMKQVLRKNWNYEGFPSNFDELANAFADPLYVITPEQKH